MISNTQTNKLQAGDVEKVTYHVINVHACSYFFKSLSLSSFFFTIFVLKNTRGLDINVSVGKSQLERDSNICVC